MVPGPVAGTPGIRAGMDTRPGRGNPQLGSFSNQSQLRPNADSRMAGLQPTESGVRHLRLKDGGIARPSLASDTSDSKVAGLQGRVWRLPACGTESESPRCDRRGVTGSKPAKPLRLC